MKNHFQFLTLLLVMLGCLLLIVACKPKEEGPCDKVDLTYNGVVKPIIALHCSTGYCHAGGNSPDISTYTKLKVYADNGSLEERLFFSDSSKQMPPINLTSSVVITADEKATLRCWIDRGYPE